MATDQQNEMIPQLRRAILWPDGAGLTDGQLLEYFLTQHDEAAFAALVRRHGSMVWGVCCRVLSNYHDAEDAFQATFLVLVRKAASIMPREMVANWLYGVAHLTALKARATAARRKGRERQGAEMPEPEVVQHDPWHDLQPLLDQELSRLPDKYRSVIVLCDLEGKTRKEAAEHFGCPEGTVAGRLARARAMLAKRLARHGLAVSSGALATMLSQEVASADVPTSMVSSTIKAASLLAAGQAAATGPISARVAALTEGVLKTMLLRKLKTVTAVLLALSMVTLTGAMLAWGQTANKGDSVEKPDQAAKQDAKPKEADPSKPKEADDSARTPPGIKAGVRLVLGSSQSKWRYDDNRSALVVRVQGNWVFLKGTTPPVGHLEGQEGCWVNFNTVHWYTIVPPK